MADNVTVGNATGQGQDFIVVTDEEVAVGHHPYTKVEFGGDGVFTKVTSTVGLPVNPVQETAGVGVGAAADAEATGNGSVIALLKRIRTLLGGTLVVDGSAVTQPVSENFHLAGAAGSTVADDLVSPTTSDYTLTTDADGDSRPLDVNRDAGIDERNTP